MDRSDELARRHPRFTERDDDGHDRSEYWEQRFEQRRDEALAADYGYVATRTTQEAGDE